MKNEKRIFLVVDGDNYFQLQKNHLGWWIDPAKLKKFAITIQEGNLAGAYYYCSYYDEVPEGKDKFLKALVHMGYSVIQRPVKHLQLADGSIRDKASMDVLIATDICLQINNFDVLILVSGDGDFVPVIEALHNRGQQFLILSTEGIVSRDLREVAGMSYIDLSAYKDVLYKEQHGNGRES